MRSTIDGQSSYARFGQVFQTAHCLHPSFSIAGNGRCEIVAVRRSPQQSGGDRVVESQSGMSDGC